MKIDFKNLQNMVIDYDYYYNYAYISFLQEKEKERVQIRLLRSGDLYKQFLTDNLKEFEVKHEMLFDEGQFRQIPLECDCVWWRYCYPTYIGIPASLAKELGYTELKEIYFIKNPYQDEYRFRPYYISKRKEWVYVNPNTNKCVVAETTQTTIKNKMVKIYLKDFNHLTIKRKFLKKLTLIEDIDEES